jgi:hypothetical protein
MRLSLLLCLAGCALGQTQPKDVRAIRIPIGDGGYPTCIWYYDGRPQIESCWDIDGKPKLHSTPHETAVARWKWTCADKSRILETAEDGTKWCHKPQTEVEENCHIERYWADPIKGDLGPIIGDPPHGWQPVGDLRIVCKKETK